MTGSVPEPRRVLGELASFLRPSIAHDVPAPTEPIGDPEVGWEPLLAMAAEHQLLPALWSALRGRGVPSLPAPLLEQRRSPLAVLELAHSDNTARVADLRRQLVRILDTLEVAGVDAVPIKGAHWLLTGLLPDPGSRIMIDLDILVPPVLADDAVGALSRIGYRPAPVVGIGPSDHQLDPLVAPGRAGSVELHLEPFVASRRRLLTADEIRHGAVAVEVDGIERRVPAPTHVAVLLIGHAQLQDDGARLLELPLRALHDLQVLGPAVIEQVDWPEVSARFARFGAEGRIALAGFAVEARRLFGVPLPVPTGGGTAWSCAVELALDHPASARHVREAVYLPTALRAERMARLYGTDRGARLWASRASHVVRGAYRLVHR